MSEEYQSHQIARIILRERFGIATDDEKQLLEAWLRESKERRWLYERVLSGETWREYADLKKDFEQMVDYGRLQNDILRSIRQRRQIRFRRRCVGWISVAAVLFVAVLMVARFRQQSVEPVRSVVALSDTVSMEIDDKVVLVLADGQKIGMSPVQRVQLADNSRKNRFSTHFTRKLLEFSRILYYYNIQQSPQCCKTGSGECWLFLFYKNFSRCPFVLF